MKAHRHACFHHGINSHVLLRAVLPKPKVIGDGQRVRYKGFKLSGDTHVLSVLGPDKLMKIPERKLSMDLLTGKTCPSMISLAVLEQEAQESAWHTRTPYNHIASSQAQPSGE